MNPILTAPPDEIYQRPLPSTAEARLIRQNRLMSNRSRFSTRSKASTRNSTRAPGSFSSRSTTVPSHIPRIKKKIEILISSTRPGGACTNSLPTDRSPRSPALGYDDEHLIRPQWEDAPPQYRSSMIIQTSRMDNGFSESSTNSLDRISSHENVAARQNIPVWRKRASQVRRKLAFIDRKPHEIHSPKTLGSDLTCVEDTYSQESVSSTQCSPSTATFSSSAASLSSSSDVMEKLTPHAQEYVNDSIHIDTTTVDPANEDRACTDISVINIDDVDGPTMHTTQDVHKCASCLCAQCRRASAQTVKTGRKTIIRPLKDTKWWELPASEAPYIEQKMKPFFDFVDH